MLDDEVLGTKDLEQFSKSADELTRKLLEITNQVDKLQTSLNGVNSSFRNIGKNATKYTNEAYVKKVVDDYEKATRKEEERINKETRKKEETKLKKDQNKTIKSIGKIGSTITTVVGSVTAAVATFSKVMKEAVSGISDARWSNSTAAIVEFGKKTEETTIKAKNAFSNILSWAGNGLGIIGNALGNILKKLPIISNIANAMNEDQLEKTLATYKGQAQQSLLGSGASGKLTTKIADFIVSAALSSARKIGGYSSDLSDADVMDTSTYETFFSMYSKLVSEPKSTWFTGYKAMKKGYGFAMTDLSPEENMALMAEAIDELKNLSVEEYNDTIKRWTKMGRVIEKFGKNLYAFDEVLTNDPFSNEDVEDINVTTNDIADKLDEGNDNDKKIVPPIDSINNNTKDIKDTNKTAADTLANILTEVQGLVLSPVINVDTGIPVLGNIILSLAKIIEGFVPKPEEEPQTVPQTVPTPEEVKEPSSVQYYQYDRNTILSQLIGLNKEAMQTVALYTGYREKYGDYGPDSEKNMATFEQIMDSSGLLAKQIYEASPEEFQLWAASNYNDTLKLVEQNKAILAQRDKAMSQTSLDSDFYKALEQIYGYTTAAAIVLNLLDLGATAGGGLAIGLSSKAAAAYATQGAAAYAAQGAATAAQGAAAAQQTAAIMDVIKIIAQARGFATGGFATGGLSTKKMPTIATLFEQGPEMVLPLNAAGADFLATSLNNLGLSNRLTNNSANVNVNLSGINIADNDREWYEVAHKIHNIIEAEQARQGG